MMVNNSMINPNTTKIETSLRPNCSTYNPCGRFGDCHDNYRGEWTCECKFWWKGTICDTLSGSGKQVIALGIITGFLVALFYSLVLFHRINKKRREPVKEKQTTTIQIVNRKSSTRTVHNSSSQILLWVTGIATVILGTSALIIKWIILKGIHEQIINKFNNNQSLFYNRPSICRIIYIREEFNLFTFPIACFLVLLFIVTTKRKSSQKKSCCNGYVAIPIPLDFFAHVKRTFAAVTFAIVANELSNIVNQFISGNGSSTDDGVIVTYLLQIVRVLVIGFHYYPILAAVYINTRFTLICATLYAWFDFSITIAFNGVCQNNYYSTNDDYNKTEGSGAIFYLDYYGTGSKLVVIQLVTDIPRYLFLAYICIKLPLSLIKQMTYRKIPGQELTREQKTLLYSSLPYSSESQYVANLFGLGDKNLPTNRITRLFRSIYTWRDDFRFSSRVLCVYASIFFLLFYITIQACVQIPPYLADLKSTRQTLSKVIMKQQVGDESTEIPFPDLVPPYLIAIFTALIVTTIQLLVLLVSIRRNLLQAFRGDVSEISRRDSSQNVQYACENIHFAGYLIGYVIWGYILIAAFAVTIAVIIDIVITYGMVGLIESVLKISIPPILFAIFQNYMNKILGHYVFLQQEGEVLSINHRRILMIFLYFNFFLDAFLGFISSIIRVLKSTIGGIIYMCRLDYSTFGRKLEAFDPGFNAYCGFIHMECAHRHPVLLYFSSLLIREHIYGSTMTRYSKARHRWYLAIFLLKNPTLIYRRKRFFIQSQTDETRMMLIGRKNMKTMCIEEPSINAYPKSTTA